MSEPRSNDFPYLHGFKQKASGPNTIEAKIGEIFGEIKNKITSGYNLREIIDHIDELRFRSQKEKHELSELYEAKIARMGNAGRNGGESGDLYVTLHVEPHALFRREGDDVHVTVPIAIDEAALGARIQVPSPDGPVRLRVPPGTQAGQRFRVRGRGAVSPRSGERGDLVVEARLVLPKILDERSKELLREFGRLNTEDVRRELAK